MSKNSVESLVRDLLKTVATLVNKVDSLESRISEQSVIISKLNSQSDQDCTRKLTSLAPCTTTSVLAAAVQRPVRSARVNASLAIAELSGAGKKRSNGRVSHAVTPTPSDRIDNFVPNTIGTTKTIQTTTKADETIQRKSSMTLQETDKLDKENKVEQWHVVGRYNNKNKRTQRPVTVGTGNARNDIQAAEKTKFIQAWSFKPKTTTGQILNFLNNIFQARYTVEKRTIRSELHASFVIGMPECAYEEVTAPAAWPPRVHFSDWFPARPRLQRGGDRNDSSV